MSASTQPHHEHKHKHGPHCNHEKSTKPKKHQTWMVIAGVLFTIGYLIWTFVYSEMLTQ